MGDGRIRCGCGDRREAESIDHSQPHSLRAVWDGGMHALAEDIRERGAGGICACTRPVLAIEGVSVEMTRSETRVLGLLQFLNLRLEFPDTPLQVRQAIERGGILQPLAILNRGITGIQGLGWNIARDSALGGDHGAVTDGKMPSGPDLSGQDGAGTDSR